MYGREASRPYQPPTNMYFNSNIKFLRNRKALTQEVAAAELNLSRSTLNSYENGSVVNPTLEALQLFSDYYKTSIDTLIRVDLSKLSDIKLDEMVQGHDTFIRGTKLRVLATTVDEKNKENIEVVHLKAAAGYKNGYADPDYIKKLPSFQLPILFNDRKYRMFQISGDSMLPIPDKSYVIAEYLENWFEIKDGGAYVFLTRDEGIVFKIAVNQVKRKKQLILHSLNQFYKPYELNVSEVQEVWKFCNFISSEIPYPASRDELLKSISVIEYEVSAMKKRMG